MITYALLCIALLLVIAFIFLALNIVPTNHVCMVEYLGRRNRIIGPGLHLILWPFESLHRIGWSYQVEGLDGEQVTRTEDSLRVDMRQRTVDTLPVGCHTKDKVSIEINGKLVYRIVDAEKIVYDVRDIMDYMMGEVGHITRRMCQRLTADDMLDEEISRSVTAEMMERMKDRGVEVMGFMIQSIDFDEKIMEAKSTIYAQTFKQ